MALSKQVNIYSVDTSAFYTQEERNFELASHQITNQIKNIQDKLNKVSKIEKKVMKLDIVNLSDKERYMCEAYFEKYIPYTLKKEIRVLELKDLIKELKVELKNLFEHRRNVEDLELREFRNQKLLDKNIISIFESSLTRMLGMNDENKIYKELVVVRAYYFNVLEDLIKDGFIMDGEEYVYFTSSAGQIRQKKAVFIKKELLSKYGKTIMCGLDTDTINEYGGMNINKYLAYTALISSATETWNEFDIDKAIVVDDFETDVTGDVDYIDYETYDIERRNMPVSIPHTDGAGIMLDKTTTMVRLPFVKGLMISCPFDKFIKAYKKEYKGCQKVKDIYGKEYDILRDNIRYIFTKSQFKLWKYYKNVLDECGNVIKTGWEVYQENFKKYNCEACKCNEEEEEISDAKINYQMIQTLSDMTDNEIKDLCGKTISKIVNAGSNKDTMLDILGVNNKNTSQSNLQKALSIYPELLKDVYCRETIKQTKASMVKEAKSSKVLVNGKYTFVCPDTYAFCEWLFLGIRTPKGLLQNGEVSCSLFEDGRKLDCLRAPHLFFEHAIRKNKTSKEIQKWYKGNSIYTSTHDLITKILQLDVDGDRLLVLDDELIVSIAERNIKRYDIVPIFYEMKKADAGNISYDSIYDSLILAFTGGNIGIISNNISKMWNSFKEPNTDENVAYNKKTLKAIKLMCMENNFVIDYAKTLFKPTRPKEIDKLIVSYTREKLPHFFKYAKDKDDSQVCEINNSTVNRFDEIVPNPNIRFTATNLGDFNYHMLMRDTNLKDDMAIINRYKELNRRKKMIAMEQWERKKRNNYVDTYIKKELLKINKNAVYVTDVLIKYLYEHNSINKNTLWNSFGHIIVRNLERNVPKNTKLCEVCGKRFEYNVEAKTQKQYCKVCSKKVDNEKAKERAKVAYLNKKNQAS